MKYDEIVKYVMGQAAKSNVEKRQVGCVIIAESPDLHPMIVGEGFNVEDYFNGPTGELPLSVHAERAAIEDMMARAEIPDKAKLIAYVSHSPCPECAKLMMERGINDVVVVEEFLKFDGDKLRYDLLPPKPIEEIVKVITDGARKYKPNNWRECKDPGRYEAAMMRHFEAYRKGELIDPESGSPHLAHAATNLVFLLELTHK